MSNVLFALLLLGQPDDDDLIREYNRREQIVSDVLARHRDHVRTRLRALYKLGRGGYARLLAESRSRSDFFVRRAAASRILTRDLAELREYARERAALEAERQRLAAAEHAPPAGLETLSLRSPLARLQIAEHFGPYRDVDCGLELSRRGLVLAVHPGDTVHAPAAGLVRFAGTLAGLGQAVVLEHQDQVFTVLFGLAADALPVAEGGRVAAGDPVGLAAGTRLGFQVRRGASALDPEPLLRHTGKR